MNAASSSRVNKFFCAVFRSIVYSSLKCSSINTFTALLTASRASFINLGSWFPLKSNKHMLFSSVVNSLLSNEPHLSSSFFSSSVFGSPDRIQFHASSYTSRACDNASSIVLKFGFDSRRS